MLSWFIQINNDPIQNSISYRWCYIELCCVHTFFSSKSVLITHSRKLWVFTNLLWLMKNFDSLFRNPYKQFIEIKGEWNEKAILSRNPTMWQWRWHDSIILIIQQFSTLWPFIFPFCPSAQSMRAASTKRTMPSCHWRYNSFF